MAQESIVCPHCKKEIPLTEAITHKIQSELKAKFEADIAVKENEFTKREQALSLREGNLLKTKADLDTEVEKRIKLEREKLSKELKLKITEEMSQEVSSLKEEIVVKGKKLQEAQKLELDLRKQKSDLEEQRQSLDLEVARKVDEAKTKIYTEATKRVNEQIASEVSSLKEEVASKTKKLQEAQRLESDLRKQKSDLEEQRRSLETEVTRKVEEAKTKVYKEVTKKVSEQMALEVSSLKDEIATKGKKIQEAQKLELELRKQKTDLEERTQSLELEVARKIDEAKSKIYEEALKQANESHGLKDKEKEKLIQDLTTQIESLRRKIEQSSQQTQGEVLELALEEVLSSSFPMDSIDPVSKGIKGADVIQTIKNQLSQKCGAIIWESKRVKNWSDGWIDKLKEDQREVGAEIAVLLTTVLPKSVKNFGMVEGVWVTDYSSLLGLATSLRLNLIQVAQIKQSIIGQNEKMEAMYHYLSGSEFKQKVEAIVEAFSSMQKDLNAEKRAMEKIWSKREKQIDRVIKNTIRMYGDMQGIVGAALPQIKIMELTAITDETTVSTAAEEEI